MMTHEDTMKLFEFAGLYAAKNVARLSHGVRSKPLHAFVGPDEIVVVEDNNPIWDVAPLASADMRDLGYDPERWGYLLAYENFDTDDDNPEVPLNSGELLIGLTDTHKHEFAIRLRFEGVEDALLIEGPEIHALTSHAPAHSEAELIEHFMKGVKADPETEISWRKAALEAVTVH
jgi:hypothetical protein